MSEPTFTPKERVVAALELCRDSTGHVSVGTGFLEALAHDLLTLPLDEITQLRADLATTMLPAVPEEFSL